MIRLSLDPKSGPIGIALGWLVLILGLTMVLHGLWAWLAQERAVTAFMCSACASIILGGTSILSFSGKPMVAFTMRQSFFLTLVSWVVVVIFSALPIYFSDIAPHWIDAVFESVSALTTTGLGVLPDSAYTGQSLKFWKVFLQWLGGFGIVMTAVILLPILRMGGNQLMRAESSDQSDKIVPRASNMAKYISGVYVLLTVCFALLLKGATYLPWWDSITYSMATISTGGIAMSSYSVLDLSDGVKGILSMAMFMGSVTFVLFVGALRGDWRGLVRDEQVRGMVKVIGFTILAVGLWHGKSSIMDIVFMSVSAVSGTGFPAESLFHFGGIFWIITLIGGCSGSASGGIKIFRLQILYRMAKNNVLRALQPVGFYPTVYGGQKLDIPEIEAIISVVFFYLAGWIVATIAFTLCGHALGDAFTLASSMLTNSGLPLGSWADRVGEFSLGTKWIAMITMLCGRFECVTLVGAVCSLVRR